MEKTRRFNLQHPLLVEYKGSLGGVPLPDLTHVGSTINISDSGMRIRLKSYSLPEIGSRVRVCIKLPRWVQAEVEDDDYIMLEAKVVWKKYGELGLKIIYMETLALILYKKLFAMH